MPAADSTRVCGLLRLRSGDGATTYERPRDAKQAARLLRGRSASARVVLVCQERLGAEYRNVSELGEFLGDPDAVTAAAQRFLSASGCLRQLASADKAAAALNREPAGFQPFIATNREGFLEVGCLERYLYVGRWDAKVLERRSQIKRFDVSCEAAEAAAYLNDCQREAAARNEQARADARPCAEAIIDGEVRAERERERVKHARDFEAALRRTATEYGVCVR